MFYGPSRSKFGSEKRWPNLGSTFGIVTKLNFDIHKIKIDQL